MIARPPIVCTVAAIALPLLAAPAFSQQAGGTSAVSATDLAAARTLYASASYEEALGALSTIDNGTAAEVEELRAACFLALGRREDAEQTLERVVRRQPLHQIKEGDVTPKLVSMFQDVRRRVLPVVTRDLYARGKVSFDARNYAAAAADLKTLLTLVGDPDLASEAASLADLKMLGEGFLKLAEAELTSPAKPAAPPAAPTQVTKTPVNTPPAGPVPSSPAGPRIYSRDDKDVKPPTAITRPLPAWKPPNPVAARATFRGILEVIVDEQGAVASSAMRQSVNPTYDKVLVDAAKSWRFQPATRATEAVTYRLLVEIALAPSGVK